MTKKTCCFCVYGHFRELLPTVLGYRVIYKAHDTQYMFERHDQKLIIFTFVAVFMSYYPQFWGSGLIYSVHDTQYMFKRHEKKAHRFCVLGPSS
jgi:hypothetical protein